MKKTKTTEKRRRHSRHLVAALKACNAICAGRTKMELHPALRLEAAKLIVAIENGVSLPTVNDRLLRKIISEEVASGEINQTLLRMSGLLDRVERNQRKVIAPIVQQSNEQIASQAEPVPESVPELKKPDPLPNAGHVTTKASDQISESLKEALRKLEAGESEASVTSVSQSEPVKATTPAPPIAVEPYLSEAELAAINEFSQLRIGASELEVELKPFLKIEWSGLDRDRITTVSLTGARIAPEDRVSITPALVERAQALAMSPSPRDQQLVREWAQMITKTPLFAVGTDVLKEIIWLKQQLSL